MQVTNNPSIVVPFETQLNAHVSDAWHDSLSWIQRLGLVSSEKAITRLNRACYDKLTGYAYPFADREGLESTMCFLLWLFLLDDQLDDCHLGDQVDVGYRVIDRLLRLVESDANESEPSRIERAWMDISAGIRKRGNPQQWRRFVSHVAAYLNSLKWEIRNRSRKHIPDPLVFAEMRRQTGAVLPAFDFIEYANAIALDESVFLEQDFRILCDCAVDVIGMVNDVISYAKEAVRGEVNNSVMVYAHAMEVSHADAARFVVNVIHARIKTFIDTKASMLAVLDRCFNAERMRAIHGYVVGMEYWMRGNLEYSRVSGRYHDIEVSQKNLPVSWIENLTSVPEESLLPPA